MRRKPKLGQNFLRDENAVARIVSALGNIGDRTVLEIGPGRGAITGMLASRARRLVAIEIDRELAPQLHERFLTNTNVEILEQDILATDLPVLAHGEKVVVVGNLPYYITSEILLRLLAEYQFINQAVLMVQKEVADRITAEPGSRDYGLLSATTQMYARAEQLFTLPPGAFFPPPEVHSTVFRLQFAPRFEELGVPEAAFIAFLRKCFAQKRKTLANNLRASGYDPVTIGGALTQSAIPVKARSEVLPLESMAALFRALHP